MINARANPSAAARRRRTFGWAVGAALLALAPKCLLCAAAYVGLAAALGLSGPELCGASSAATPAWVSAAAALGLVASGAWVGWRLVSRRPVRYRRRTTP